MNKLPEGVAKLRQIERNKANNQFRKDNKIKTIIILTDERKKEMRDYAIIYRAKQKADQNKLKDLKYYEKKYREKKRSLKKVITIERLQQAVKDRAERIERMAIFKAERSKLNRIARNKRANDKYHATKPTAKKREIKPPQTLKITDKKPKPEVTRMKTIIQDLSTRIKFQLDSKTIIFVKPGADLDEVRRRYNR